MISEDNLKKLHDNVQADRATWCKIVDEVIADERRSRDEDRDDEKRN